MNNFTQLYEIIYKEFCKIAESQGKHKSEITQIGMARFLNASQGRVQNWAKGTWPKAKDLENISKKLGFSYRWLVTGKGDPFGKIEERPTKDPEGEKEKGSLPPIPMIGLAACGMQGLEQIMPYAVAVSPVKLSARAVAVIASGESMVPAGIASGHVCYCDPEQEPMEGEAVFLRQKDNLGGLKLFLGEGGEAGMTAFKGWLSPDERGYRKEFILNVKPEHIDYIAPVVLVRRRL